MPDPYFWMVMNYQCKDCEKALEVYLENGCEGDMLGVVERIVPVPFTVSCDCGGYFLHVSWNRDRKLFPLQKGIPEAPHFRYPSKTEFKRYKDRACGRPVGFSSWNMPTQRNSV